MAEKTPGVEEGERRVKKPLNYADIMRKTRDFHQYTFKLPRAQPRKEDIEHVSKLESIRRLYQLGASEEFIQRKIFEKARDRHINEKLDKHPQWKSAITRQWYGTKHKPGLKNYITSVEKGDATFVKLKNANRRSILSRMKTTNKGAFVLTRGITYRFQGRGKNLRLVTVKRDPDASGPSKGFYKSERLRREQFFPFPKGVDIEEYVAELWEIHKPNSASIGVMSAIGNQAVDSITGFNYVFKVIQQAKMRNKTHPFSGVYFYWY